MEPTCSSTKVFTPDFINKSVLHGLILCVSSYAICGTESETVIPRALGQFIQRLSHLCL